MTAKKAVTKAAAKVPQKVLSVEEILEARGKEYGEFEEHARITQNIKAAYKDSPNWNSLSPAMKESLEMNAHKVGRKQSVTVLRRNMKGDSDLRFARRDTAARRF